MIALVRASGHLVEKQPLAKNSQFRNNKRIINHPPTATCVISLYPYRAIWPDNMIYFSGEPVCSCTIRVFGWQIPIIAGCIYKCFLLPVKCSARIKSGYRPESCVEIQSNNIRRTVSRRRVVVLVARYLRRGNYVRHGHVCPWNSIGRCEFGESDRISLYWLCL